MSPEEIRTLDGTGLTRLAFMLGLAPDGTDLWGEMENSMLYDFAASEPWEPHVNLRQADEVFRQLRTLGWNINASSDAKGGTALAHKHLWIRLGWGNRILAGEWSNESSEAMALLRCACLAVASAQEERA